ncbi:hypothetical protein PYR71_30745, partial [Rhizobium sp. MC63]|nr:MULTISPECIES: hypothetical protein [Rhizobium]MBB4193284.1 hypothetical protein [Rhizobium aethiopicum]MBB4582983.1 hypothetical protein [Rhizobium aethiopicum]MCJ9696036.1 hypothetical protein [Rhizobium sp. PRIMUS64]MDC7747100.1 hypothetical protein [Rhizobium sp. BC56]MDC9813979.1 hypothetical protein [Rhizobium sp. MC62]
MKDEVNEDIFDHVAKKIKADQNIASRQLGIICATIAAYGAVIFFAFLIFRAHPSISCEFVNNQVMLRFWPPNTAILSALKTSRYSQSDQCLLIAMRSLASVVMLPAVVVFLVKQLFASDSYHVQGMMTAFIIILAASLASAYIGPTEHYSRYRMSFESPIEVNIWKSMIHIFGFYLAAFVLAFRLPAYIRSTRR